MGTKAYQSQQARRTCCLLCVVYIWLKARLEHITAYMMQFDESQQVGQICDASYLLEDSAPPELAPVVPAGCAGEAAGAGAGAPELLT